MWTCEQMCALVFPKAQQARHRLFLRLVISIVIGRYTKHKDSFWKQWRSVQAVRTSASCPPARWGR